MHAIQKETLLGSKQGTPRPRMWFQGSGDISGTTLHRTFELTLQIAKLWL